MASSDSENTPFLAEHERDEYLDVEGHDMKKTPANAHFKRPLRLITALVSFLSIGMFVTLIVTSVFLKTGNFTYSWSAEEVVKSLAIISMVTFVLHTPSIFLDIPILLTLACHIAMSITVFIFSGKIFGNAWPSEYICRKWVYDPDTGRSHEDPASWRCLERMGTLRILMGVVGGVGMVVGLLLLTLILLRVIALARTRFWENMKVGNFKGMGWNPSGFTVQFTLKVIPARRERENERIETETREEPAGEEQARLIET